MDGEKVEDAHVPDAQAPADARYTCHREGNEHALLASVSRFGWCALGLLLICRLFAGCAAAVL
jgi:hypothetical protein